MLSKKKSYQQFNCYKLSIINYTLTLCALVILITYGHAQDKDKNMEKSIKKYNEELEIIAYANKLRTDAKNSTENKFSDEPLPEVISEKEVAKKLKHLQQVFYISGSDIKHAKSFNKNTLTIKYFDFETILKKPYQNTGIGIRWTDAVAKSGKSLIDPQRIVSKNDLRLLYVSHTNGVVNDEGLGLFLGKVPLVKDWVEEEIDYVTGDVHIVYFPGYEKFKIKKTALDKKVTFGNGVKVHINEITTRYVNFIFDYESFKAPIVVAYNKQGKKVLENTWCYYVLYKNMKSAADFTSETFSERGDESAIALYASFHGEIDHFELYFKKDKVKKVIPIRTAHIVPMNLKYKDYKTIAKGPVSIHSEPPVYREFTKEEAQKQIMVNIAPSSAMINNDIETTIHLPDALNSTFATSYYDRLHVQEGENARPFPIEVYERVNGVITSYYHKRESEDTEQKELKLSTGKTRLSGKTKIVYPTKVKWYEAGAGTTKLPLGHRVTIEGGLVIWYPPIGYDDNLPGFMEYKKKGIIVAYNKDDFVLKKLKNSSFSNSDFRDGIKFGYWGKVAKIKLAIIEEWDTLNHYFQASTPIDTTDNSGLEDFTEFLLETGLLTITVDGKSVKYRDIINEGGEKFKIEKSLPIVNYQVFSMVNQGAENQTSVGWTGQLPGKEPFTSSHVKILLEEAAKLTEYMRGIVVSDDRSGDLDFTFSVLDNTKKVLTTFNEKELLDLQNKHKEIKEHAAELLQQKKAWHSDSDDSFPLNEQGIAESKLFNNF